MKTSKTTRNYPIPAGLEVGHTYFSGSSIYPTLSTFLGVTSFDGLGDDDRRAHETLGLQHGYDPRTTRYAVYERHGKVSAIGLDVFVATEYETNDAQIEAYTAKAGAK